MARREAQGLPRARRRLDRNPLRREVEARRPAALLPALSAGLTGRLQAKQPPAALAVLKQIDFPARPLLDLVARASGDSQDASAGDGDGLADMDRLEIYQATGMLISQLEVDADEAMLRLRAHAIGTGQTASEVAWAIVERRLVLERDHLGGADGRTYP